MECPHCGLLNPPSAAWCDCGYEFSTGRMRPSSLAPRRRGATILAAVSFTLASAGAAYLLVAPTYAGFQGDRATHATMVEINGQWVLIPILFPVFSALLPLCYRTSGVRIAAAVLIGGLAVIGSMSIGMFYLPAAIAMMLAACIGVSPAAGDVHTSTQN